MRKNTRDQLALSFAGPPAPLPAAAKVEPLREKQRHAPFERKSDTSREAADSHTTGALAKLEAVVLEVIRSAGDAGVTDDQIEMLAQLTHQSASARRRGLVLRGLVVDSNRRRLTRGNRNAVVWVLAPTGETK